MESDLGRGGRSGNGEHARELFMHFRGGRGPHRTTPTTSPSPWSAHTYFPENHEERVSLIFKNGFQLDQPPCDFGGCAAWLVLDARFCPAG